MTTYIVSDIHLRPQLTGLNNHFEEFLKNIVPNAKHLYILGDLFDIWFGDDCMNDFQYTWLKKIANYTKHCNLYFLPGNRDFLVGKKFYELTAAEQLSDPCIVNIYDQKILLMHGDLLCANDVNYQIYRAVVRNRLILKFYFTLPVKLREMIAKGIRNHSKTSIKKKYVRQPEKFNINLKKLKYFVTKYNISSVVHGHTHQPFIHTNEIANLQERIVLGDWSAKLGSILKIQDCLTKKLLEF